MRELVVFVDHMARNKSCRDLNFIDVLLNHSTIVHLLTFKKDFRNFMPLKINLNCILSVLIFVFLSESRIYNPSKK